MAHHPRHRGEKRHVAAPAHNIDTIAAPATPAGLGGIAVVRVAGPVVPEISEAVLGRLPSPRAATASTFRRADGSVIDRGIAIYFPAPHSFTGDHVLELHAHGAPVVVDMLLRELLTLGARLARAGEFSERAFLNGKMDLIQAEAVADLINAGSEVAARGALRSLSGEFSKQVHRIADGMARLRTHVEAAIDFPEEDIDFLADEKIANDLSELLHSVDSLLEQAKQGCLLQTGMTLVLAGAPNAGKSSLLNALARDDTAIVSPIPGTTRDIVRARIDVDGMPIHVLDTAGLRVSPDPVELEGIARARAAMMQADRVLLLVDDTAADAAFIGAQKEQLPEGVRTTLIYSKIDLSGRAPGLLANGEGVALSAKTGAGLEALRGHLRECMGYLPAGEGGFVARRRHVDALTRTRKHLDVGQQQLREYRAGELLAEELRQSHRALGEITGEFSSEELLGQIFSSFCIGK